MAKRIREELVCDAPRCPTPLENVRSCEVILNGRLYEPDWCSGHRTEVKRLLGSIKPKRGRSSSMVPVNPAEVPRTSKG